MKRAWRKLWIFWPLFYDDGNGDTLGSLYHPSIV